MGSDVSLIITTLFGHWFDMLRSVQFPGTDFSIFSLLMISLFISIVFSLVFSLLGLGSLARGGQQKGGNNRKVKVSKERQGDTK